jgi:hypothetical protein
MTPLVIWTLVLVIYFLPTIVSGRFNGFASYLIATGIASILTLEVASFAE